MEFLRRKRKKPPIQAFGPPALHTVTVELRESWTQASLNDVVREERTGPSYRWTVELTTHYRLALVNSIKHRYGHKIRVSGGSTNSIELRASGELHPATLRNLRRHLIVAQDVSRNVTQPKPAIV